MIDHGLSIRDDKVYLTIPKKAGSSFREVVVNAKRYLKSRRLIVSWSGSEMFKPEELPCLECMERDRCRDGLKCLSRWKYEKDSGYDAMAKKVRDRIREQSQKRLREA